MPISIAFIGCGSHSTNNLYPALAYADCVLDAVCDRDIALAERNARLYGAKSIYTDIQQMLNERKPQAVIAVGPPGLHYEAAKAALSRGIPIYVEKPTAPDLAMTRELVALARANGTFIMTGFMKRFGTAYKTARQLITEKTFIPSVVSIKYGHWEVKDLAHMLHFMSSHPIDLALSFLGRPISVSSHLVRSQREAISICATLRFASGTMAQLMLDSSQPRIQERVEISGSMNGGNALIVADNVDHFELHRQGHHGIDLMSNDMHAIEPVFNLEDIQMWRPDYGIPNMGQTRLFFQGFAGAVREFVAAVAEKRDCYPLPEEAVATMEVIDAIMKNPNGVTQLGEAALFIQAKG